MQYNRVVGFNSAYTLDGRPQIDGACALYKNGEIFAVAEERLSLNKHDAGCARALPVLLKQAQTTIEAIELFCVSSCGERIPDQQAEVHFRKDRLFLLDELGIPRHKVVFIPSHHLAHALQTNCLSKMAPRPGRKLHLVMDYQGYTGESNSLYEDCGSGLVKLANGSSPGVGYIYHHVCQALGFDGHTEAGKVMALAGMKPSATGYSFFTNSNSQILPGANFAEFIKQPIDLKGALANAPNSVHEQGLQVAGALQTGLEQAVAQYLQCFITDDTSEIWLSGGVATNCRLLAALQEHFPGLSVRGCFAPGDTGQSLGNIIYALKNKLNPPNCSLSPFCGPQYSPQRIEQALANFLQQDGQLQANELDVSLVVEHLLAGKIVGLWQGRSELGPRALGHRSMLANPAIVGIKNAMNKRKSREWYRPLGIAMFDMDTPAIFGQAVNSPYMDLAPKTLAEYRNTFPEAIHADGSCRVQTLATGDHSTLAHILRHLSSSMKVPHLINTSMNSAGQPMAETPEAALQLLQDGLMDTLVLDRFYILNKQLT